MSDGGLVHQLCVCDCVRVCLCVCVRVWRALARSTCALREPAPSPELLFCFPPFPPPPPLPPRPLPYSYAAVKTLTQRKELFGEWQSERGEVLKRERKQVAARTRLDRPDRPRSRWPRLACVAWVA